MFRKIVIVLGLIFFPLAINAQEDIDSPAEIRMETAIEKAGDIGQFVPMAASITLLLVNGDKEGGWQYLKGFGANMGATYALKYAINKPRPDGATDGHAFPSGHTSFAFQGASFIQRRYGWGYGIPAYAIAGFVAYSRVEGLNDRHDWYDVTAGAIVGIASTYLFTTPYQRDHFELSYSSANDTHQIGLTFKF
ncbi:phosphatase PAP2 family protein [Nonlabens dokdonensis]|mgnify:CR=1 FL=1|uniref:phosphatase PAP2 family protein n=1 Tax=Nonlabens dokdonensis TaxID=328515 RepID=UPI0026186805|nr:phosphatase PAP2 family protein [Nonlabens dokdonensis]